MRLPLLCWLLLAILGGLANCQEDPGQDDPAVDEEPVETDDQAIPDPDEVEGSDDKMPSDPDEPIDEAGDPDGPPDQPAFHSEPLSDKTLRALHAKIDENSDGKIVIEEAVAFGHKMSALSVSFSNITETFVEADTNKDGKMSIEERVHHITGSPEGSEDDEMQRLMDDEKAKFKLADTDGDGLLTPDEAKGLYNPDPSGPIFQLMAETSLKKLDLDSNGELTAEEFWAPEHVDGEPEELSEEQKEEFAAADKDKSGTLNLEEIKHWEQGGVHLDSAMKQLFEVADSDHDGFISADELAQSGEHLAEEMGPSAHYHLTEWAEHHEL